MRKVIVPYAHRSEDLTQIDLAVTRRAERPAAWLPALRDTVDGERVVWAKFDDVPSRGCIWVRDRLGPRVVKVGTII